MKYLLIDGNYGRTLWAEKNYPFQSITKKICGLTHTVHIYGNLNLN